MENENRYNKLNKYLKNKFGERTLKICVDGGFTCPNRDGTVAKGGCIFCSERGSGEHINNCADNSISGQISNYFKSYKSERANKFIVYFQNFTNTYDNIENLKIKYDSSLIDDRIVGISIATRPDCINEDVVKLLHSYIGTDINTNIDTNLNINNTTDSDANATSDADATSNFDANANAYATSNSEADADANANAYATSNSDANVNINKKYYVEVELGLQTSNDKTGKFINRGYSSNQFTKAVSLLNKYNIDVIAHIMIGLPGEDFNDLKNTVNFLNSHNIQGIKIHSTYVVENTKLCDLYNDGLYDPISLNDYLEKVVYVLTHINPNVVVHRISGDAPKDLLVAPEWNSHKKLVLNGVDRILREQDLWQGMYFDERNVSS